MGLKFAMDADCLIKLTKAGIKERVCEVWQVCVTQTVRYETVERAPTLPDAERIGANIAAGRIVLVPLATPQETKGEDTTLALYNAGGFDAVATDDARFIRHLRGLGIPYAVPGVIVVHLRQAGVLTEAEAGRTLAALRPHISPDEHAASLLMLSGGRSR